MQEPELERRQNMLRILEDYEMKSALVAKPAFYAKELLEGLDARVVKGVITRNSRRSAEIVAEDLDLSLTS